MKKKLLFLNAAFLLSSTVYNAQINKISFETSEGYTLGNIGSQQGWTYWGGIPPANAQVVNNNATNGVNSLNVTSNEDILDFCGIEKNIASLVTSNDIEISFDYRFEDIDGSDYEMAVYNDGTDYYYTAAFKISYLTGALSYRTATGFIAGPVLAPNQWHNLKMVIKKSDDTLQYFANGTQIYSGALGTYKNSQIIDFIYDDYGTGFRVDNISINNLSALSTQENSRKDIIKVYPNPATEKISIETDDKIETIAFFDSQGKLIRNYTENGISNGKTIDISDFVSGMYMVKVKTKTSEFTKKIIKK
ncbi:T9SS type A sorting domain-containing protein [Chryseobacterium echinoideorum]|uniref:T9SS type A sorting domain-containing protein n=1 Tax=Chryseobacterium echinoideorum TaxID=1549648 RepID=UPI0011853453|nr:T9SS type A sorting domain-containing protein [Chryseobacterium echinoideorum]